MLHMFRKRSKKSMAPRTASPYEQHDFLFEEHLAKLNPNDPYDEAWGAFLIEKRSIILSQVERQKSDLKNLLGMEREALEAWVQQAKERLPEDHCDEPFVTCAHKKKSDQMGSPVVFMKKAKEQRRGHKVEQNMEQNTEQNTEQNMLLYFEQHPSLMRALQLNKKQFLAMEPKKNKLLIRYKGSIEHLILKHHVLPECFLTASLKKLELLLSREQKHLEVWKQDPSRYLRHTL